MKAEPFEVRNRFREELALGNKPKISEFIKSVATEHHALLVKDLISAEVCHRMNHGLPVAADEYEEFGDDVIAHAILEIVKNKSQSAIRSHAGPGADGSEDVTVIDQVKENVDPNQTIVEPDGKSSITNQTTGYFGRKDVPKGGSDFLIDPHQESEDKDFRFEIQKLHAAGGLGEVFIATDRELDRKVAFKRIRNEWVDDEMARQRFNLESYVTGNLEHPGIVPVYSAGDSGDGCPYYAMRFVRGKNMKEEITALYRSSKPDRAFYHGLEFRNLLHHFVDACNTFAYAHSKGVLHRDIKPSNIMLGKYGETLIVDWGLAKKLDQPDIFPSSLVDDVSMMTQVSDRASSATIQGSTIGTPAFMSPEQAKGKLDKMDTRSDVYSLGSTLYMLITNQPPYSGASGLAIIDLVQQGKFPRPTEIQSNVPRQLESICLKSMSFDPSERYATAAEFASDIQKFLADQSVEVHQETILDRGSRWMRKNRSAALSIAAGLTALTLVSMVAAIIIHNERTRSSTALKNELAATVEAEEALRKELNAKQQSRDFFNGIFYAAFDPEQRPNELDNDQRDLYVSFVNQIQSLVSDSSIPGLEKGDLLSKRALMELALKRPSKAKESISLAIKTLKNEEGDSFDLFSRLCRAYWNQGKIHFAEKQYESAIKDYQNAATYLKRLMETNESYSHKAMEAGLTENKGVCYDRLGNSAQTLLCYQAASELYSSLLSIAPDRDTVFNSIKAQTNLATHFAKKTETRHQAIDIHVACKHKLNELLEHSNEKRIVSFANQNLSSLAACYLLDRRYSDAAKQYKLAIESQQKLTQGHPKNQRYRRQLADLLLGLGKSQNKIDESNAKENLLKAKAILEKLAAEDERHNEQLANCLMEIGRFYEGKNENKSRANFAAAHDIRVSNLDPADRAIETDSFLGKQINIANSLRKQGLCAEAVEILADVARRIDENGNLKPKVVRAGRFVYASCLTELHHWDDAARVWQKLALNLNDPKWRQFEIQRAICLAQLGRLSEGTGIAESLIQSRKVAPVEVYDVACCFAVAASYLTTRNQETDSSGNNLQWYLAKAMDKLNRAGEAGFFEDEGMKQLAATDQDLDSLREMPEFIQLCKKYEIEIE